MEKIIIKNNITVINDCYNASLEAMIGSLETLSKINGRKVAILGDMKELGDYTKQLHEKVGKTVSELNIDVLVTVGEYGRIIANETINNGLKNVYSFDNNKQVMDVITTIIKPNDCVLLKASNSMKFIELVEYLKNL